MPNQHQLSVNGIEIAVFEWGEAHATQPDILFAHATGFHARIWDQVITLLPNYHCYTIDMRGHGRSSKPTQIDGWHEFGQDIVEVGQALGLSASLGVGHSIGGHAMTWAAAHQPDLFVRLLLIDPVILPRDYYVGVVERDHFTARRRNQWESPDEMFERFKDRPPFNIWKPQVLRDYVDYGLLPNPEGNGFVLACPPAFEALSYNYGTATNIYPEIATIRIPVTILRANNAVEGGVVNLSGSPTAPDLAAQFSNAVDVSLPQYSHFIPMEAPELVAEYVRKLAKELP